MALQDGLGFLKNLGKKINNRGKEVTQMVTKSLMGAAGRKIETGLNIPEPPPEAVVAGVVSEMLRTIYCDRSKWVKNSSTCMGPGCREKINFANRHHCRGCGIVLCETCGLPWKTYWDVAKKAAVADAEKLDTSSEIDEDMLKFCRDCYLKLHTQLQEQLRVIAPSFLVRSGGPTMDDSPEECATYERAWLSIACKKLLFPPSKKKSFFVVMKGEHADGRLFELGRTELAPLSVGVRFHTLIPYIPHEPLVTEGKGELEYSLAFYFGEKESRKEGPTEDCFASFPLRMSELMATGTKEGYAYTVDHHRVAEVTLTVECAETAPALPAHMTECQPYVIAVEDTAAAAAKTPTGSRGPSSPATPPATRKAGSARSLLPVGAPSTPPGAASRAPAPAPAPAPSAGPARMDIMSDDFMSAPHMERPPASERGYLEEPDEDEDDEGTPGEAPLPLRRVVAADWDGGGEGDDFGFEDVSVRKALVLETLTESPFAFEIPFQYLHLIYEEANEAYSVSMAMLAETDKYDAALPARKNTVDGWAQHVCCIVDGLAVCKAGSFRGRTFRPSLVRAEPSMQFVPVNLHVQKMFVTNPPIHLTRSVTNLVAIAEDPACPAHTTVTVGAFAAHGYKFKNGGLRKIYETPGMLSTNRWEVRAREQACMSMALTTLITAFVDQLDAAMRSADRGALGRFLLQVVEAGYLISFESLLSTYGDESGMLEDHIIAIKNLVDVTLELLWSPDFPPNVHTKPKAFAVLKGHEAGLLVVKVPIAGAAPTGFVSGMLVRVVPVIFQFGVSEVRTVVGGPGSAELQVVTNTESAAGLQNYYESYKVFRDKNREIALPLRATTDAALEEIKLNSTIHKENVLLLCAAFVRLLGGARVTSCKSAKDRTSMSVTLEQAHILVTHCGATENPLEIATAMRSRGVRLENVFKNTGSRKYALNVFLREGVLPAEYKPPPGTGKTGMET